MRVARWPAVLAWALASSTPAAQQVQLDARNTRVAFEVSRFGRHWVQTHFTEFSGHVSLDPAGAASAVDVMVSTASLDCEDRRLDARLRSADWLDVRHYPQLDYHSRSVQFDGHGGATVLGVLTLHGITRAVTLQIQALDCPHDDPHRCSFRAQGSIRRSLFGLTRALWLTGDEVTLLIESPQPTAAPSAAPAGTPVAALD